MFDVRLTAIARRLLDPAGHALARRGVSANSVTVLGFAAGLCGAAAIAAGWYGTGLAGIVLNRVCDGLDGAIARTRGATDLGGFLDIVLDFIFYGAVPLAFAIADPSQATPAAVLLASFLASGGSFLAFAAIAAKRGMSAALQTPKSFFYARGLAEGGETVAFMLVVCIWPTWFAPAAYVFAVMCWLTAVQRILMARGVFVAETKKPPSTAADR